MSPLLSASGEAALAALLNENPLLAFDFDGTLSPMVTLPWDARMPAGVVSGFRLLCGMLPVAVITGRGVDDLVPRLPAMPKYIIGNHGAEGMPGQEHNIAVYRDVCERWMQQIRDGLHWDAIDPGLMIECKATSICLHYRLARDRIRLERHIEATLPELDPAPLIIGGALGINLLPPGAPNKRQALESLLEMEGKRAALYIGDDETDEIVFRNASPEWVTVRVGREPGTAARFFLRHQSEMTDCLHTMVRLLRTA